MVLTWQAKVIAAAAAAAADADAAAETNWKHKVTPDWGDLIKLDVIFNNSFWNHNFRLWKFCSFDGGHFIQSSLYPRQYAAAFIIIHGYRGFRKIPQTAVPKGCFSNQWWYGQRSPMHGVTDSLFHSPGFLAEPEANHGTRKRLLCHGEHHSPQVYSNVVQKQQLF